MPAQAILADTAAALIHARRTATKLAEFPGPIPATLGDAYALQRAVLRGIGGAVLGWKIGRIPTPDVARLGCDRLAGPILDIAQGGSGEARVFPGGAGAVEAEFMMRLAHVPGGPPADDDAARLLVDRVCAGIEVASSPVRTIHDTAPFGIIADLGINNGNLLGPEFGRDDGFDELEIVTRIDGAVVGTGRACDVLDGPFGALRFLLDLHFAGTVKVAAGQWISAGAITGVHTITVGQVAEVAFGDRGRLSCRAVAQMPESEHA